MRIIVLLFLTFTAIGPVLGQEEFERDVRVIHEYLENQNRSCIEPIEGAQVCTQMIGTNVQLTVKAELVPTEDAEGPVCTHLEVQYMTGTGDQFESKQTCAVGAESMSPDDVLDLFMDVIRDTAHWVRSRERRH